MAALRKSLGQTTGKETASKKPTKAKTSTRTKTTAKGKDDPPAARKMSASARSAARKHAWVLVDLPAPESHLLVVFRTDLAIDCVRRSMVAGVTVAEPALRALIVPKCDGGLLGRGRHRSLGGEQRCDSSPHCVQSIGIGDLANGKADHN